MGYRLYMKPETQTSLIVTACKWAAALALALPLANARATPHDSGLRVKVDGLKSDRGDVIFALYNSRETFTKHLFRSAIHRINHRRAEWVIRDLPPGDYALVLVHDKNGNHDMDRNMLGIPEEPYAFSNNVTGFVGAPGFDKAKFTVSRGMKVVTIHLP